MNRFRLTVAFGGVLAMSALADVQLPPFDGYVTEAPQVVFRGVRLNELTRFYGAVAGASSTKSAQGETIAWYSRGRFVKVAADSVSVQFPIEDARFSQLKTVKLVFRQSGDDITAAAEYAKFTGLTAQNTAETYDFDNGGNPASIKTSDSSGGYGVKRIIVLRAGRDRLSWPAFLPGTAQPLNWMSQGLSEFGEFRAIVTGASLKFPQTAWGFFGTAASDAASVQLQSFQDMYPSDADNYTRYLKLELGLEDDVVSARISRVAFGGGKQSAVVANLPGKVDMDTKSASYNQTLAVAEKGSHVSVRNLTAERMKVRIFPEYPNYLTKEDVVLWKGRALDEGIVLVGGSMGGTSSGANGPVGVYNVKYDADAKVLTAQLQNLDGVNVKCVGIRLAQSGDDVVGRVAYARYRATTTMSSPAFLGYDFDTEVSTDYPTIATQPGAAGYGAFGISMIALDDPGDAIVWTGGGMTTAWDEPANWKDNRVPASSDTVMFFNGADGVTVSGDSALSVRAVETYSFVAPVRFECPVSITGDFEPTVSAGGLVFRRLDVSGALAPKGAGKLMLEGGASALRLSLGNAGHRQTTAYDYGFQSALVYELGGAGSHVFGEISGLDILQKEVLRLSGTNVVSEPLYFCANSVLAIAAGVTMLPDIVPTDGGMHSFVHAGATLALADFKNSYAFPISFEGAGRVAFGAGGYPVWTTNSFTGVSVATAGSEFTFAGCATVPAGEPLRFAPVDADGTPRRIVYDGSMVGGDGIVVSGGGTFALADGIAVGKLTVADGSRLAMVGEASVGDLGLGDGGAVLLGTGGCLTLADVDVDFAAFPVFAAEDAVLKQVVLKAKSFANVPEYVTVEGNPNVRYATEVRFSDGLSCLLLRKPRKGLMLILR